MFISRCPALTGICNMENKIGRNHTMILLWDPTSNTEYLGLGTGGRDIFAVVPQRRAHFHTTCCCCYLIIWNFALFVLHLLNHDQDIHYQTVVSLHVSTCACVFICLIWKVLWTPWSNLLNSKCLIDLLVKNNSFSVKRYYGIEIKHT
jgi:hypothetical protein